MNVIAVNQLSNEIFYLYFEDFKKENIRREKLKEIADKKYREHYEQMREALLFAEKQYRENGEVGIASMVTIIRLNKEIK